MSYHNLPPTQSNQPDSASLNSDAVYDVDGDEPTTRDSNTAAILSQRSPNSSQKSQQEQSNSSSRTSHHSSQQQYSKLPLSQQQPSPQQQHYQANNNSASAVPPLPPLPFNRGSNGVNQPFVTTAATRSSTGNASGSNNSSNIAAPDNAIMAAQAAARALTSVQAEARCQCEMYDGEVAEFDVSQLIQSIEATRHSGGVSGGGSDGATHASPLHRGGGQSSNGGDSPYTPLPMTPNGVNGGSTKSENSSSASLNVSASSASQPLRGRELTHHRLESCRQSLANIRAVLERDDRIRRRLQSATQHAAAEEGGTTVSPGHSFFSSQFAPVFSNNNNSTLIPMQSQHHHHQTPSSSSTPLASLDTALTTLSQSTQEFVHNCTTAARMAQSSVVASRDRCLVAGQHKLRDLMLAFLRLSASLTSNFADLLPRLCRIADASRSELLSSQQRLQSYDELDMRFESRAEALGKREEELREMYETLTAAEAMLKEHHSNLHYYRPHFVAALAPTGHHQRQQHDQDQDHHHQHQQEQQRQEDENNHDVCEKLLTKAGELKHDVNTTLLKVNGALKNPHSAVTDSSPSSGGNTNGDYTSPYLLQQMEHVSKSHHRTLATTTAGGQKRMREGDDDDENADHHGSGGGGALNAAMQELMERNMQEQEQLQQQQQHQQLAVPFHHHQNELPSLSSGTTHRTSAVVDSNHHIDSHSSGSSSSSGSSVDDTPRSRSGISGVFDRFWGRTPRGENDATTHNNSGSKAKSDGEEKNKPRRSSSRQRDGGRTKDTAGDSDDYDDDDDDDDIVRL